MEIKVERKIDTTEIKEKLNKAINGGMKDRTYVSVSKDDLKDIISILEYLEECDICEAREECKIKSKKYCFGCYWVSIACMFCNMSELCKQASKNKGISDEKVN